MTWASSRAFKRGPWAIWLVRWLWLLAAAVALAASSTGGQPAALWGIALYSLCHIGQGLLMLRLPEAAFNRSLAAAIDLLFPPLLLALQGGFPSLLWLPLLSGPLSLGVLQLAGGPLVGLMFPTVLAWGGLTLRLGSMAPATVLSVLHFAVILPAAIVIIRLAQRVRVLLMAADDSGKLQRRVWGSVLPELDDSDWSTAIAPNSILARALEDCLARLAEAGLESRLLLGVALHRRGNLLEQVHAVNCEGAPELRLSIQVAEQEGSGLRRRGRDDLAGELRQWADGQNVESLALLPLTPNGETTGALLLAHRDRQGLSEVALQWIAQAGMEAEIALRFAQLYRWLLDERDRLGEIQEEARRKLARDLHDGPTQVIAAIAMRTNFARRQLARTPEAAAEELEKVEAMARATTKEIRNMLFSLRPLILESQGLCAALAQYADKVHDTHGQNLILDLDQELEDELSPEAQTALFYIVEEAVTNGLKHAAAADIWIRMLREGDEIVVEVEDNGVGFNVGAVDANYEQRGSLGMVTMRERAELLAAVLHVESEEGRGTQIQVRVPLKADGSRLPRAEPQVHPSA